MTSAKGIYNEKCDRIELFGPLHFDNCGVGDQRYAVLVRERLTSLLAVAEKVCPGRNFNFKAHWG